MEVAYFFKDLTKAEEKKMYDYFGKKVPALKRLLAKFDDDAVMLHVKGERFKKHAAFEVEITLKIPSKTFVATEDSHSLEKGIDFAKDRLQMQLTRYIEELRAGKRAKKAMAKARTKEAE